MNNLERLTMPPQEDEWNYITQMGDKILDQINEERNLPRPWILNASAYAMSGYQSHRDGYCGVTIHAYRGTPDIPIDLHIRLKSEVDTYDTIVCNIDRNESVRIEKGISNTEVISVLEYLLSENHCSI